MLTLMRSGMYVIGTFLGIIASSALATKLSEQVGLLDLMGISFSGVVWGVVCLTLVGVLTALYIARDMAVWALNASTLEESLESSPKTRDLGLREMVEEILHQCGWRWRAPQMYVYPDGEINVIALSAGRRRSALLVSSGLLEQCSRSEVRALVTHSVRRLVIGEMTALLIMLAMIIPLTLFPARMMALLLGTSLRSAEEETPSDVVETLMVVVLETTLAWCGACIMRQFSRSSVARADDAIKASPLAQSFDGVLERDQTTRRLRHKERFTAPFCALDLVRPFEVWFRYHPATASRLARRGAKLSSQEG